jgi:hypothetical protein
MKSAQPKTPVWPDAKPAKSKIPYGAPRAFLKKKLPRCAEFSKTDWTDPANFKKEHDRLQAIIDDLLCDFEQEFGKSLAEIDKCAPHVARLLRGFDYKTGVATTSPWMPPDKKGKPTKPTDAAGRTRHFKPWPLGQTKPITMWEKLEKMTSWQGPPMTGPEGLMTRGVRQVGPIHPSGLHPDARPLTDDEQKAWDEFLAHMELHEPDSHDKCESAFNKAPGKFDPPPRTRNKPYKCESAEGQKLMWTSTESWRERFLHPISKAEALKRARYGITPVFSVDQGWNSAQGRYLKARAVANEKVTHNRYSCPGEHLSLPRLSDVMQMASAMMGNSTALPLHQTRADIAADLDRNRLYAEQENDPMWERMLLETELFRDAPKEKSCNTAAPPCMIVIDLRLGFFQLAAFCAEHNVLEMWDPFKEEMRYFLSDSITFGNLHSIHNFLYLSSFMSHLADFFGIPLVMYVDDAAIIAPPELIYLYGDFWLLINRILGLWISEEKLTLPRLTDRSTGEWAPVQFLGVDYCCDHLKCFLKTPDDKLQGNNDLIDGLIEIFGEQVFKPTENYKKTKDLVPKVQQIVGKIGSLAHLRKARLEAPMTSYLESISAHKTLMRIMIKATDHPWRIEICTNLRLLKHFSNIQPLAKITFNDDEALYQAQSDASLELSEMVDRRGIKLFWIQMGGFMMRDPSRMLAWRWSGTKAQIAHLLQIPFESVNIFVLELVAAIITFGLSPRRSRNLIHVDNIAAVSAIVNGWNKKPSMIYRSLSVGAKQLLVDQEKSLYATYVHTRHNGADRITRTRALLSFIRAANPTWICRDEVIQLIQNVTKIRIHQLEQACVTPATEVRLKRARREMADESRAMQFPTTNAHLWMDQPELPVDEVDPHASDTFNDHEVACIN